MNRALTFIPIERMVLLVLLCACFIRAAEEKEEGASKLDPALCYLLLESKDPKSATDIVFRVFADKAECKNAGMYDYGLRFEPVENKRKADPAKALHFLSVRVSKIENVPCFFYGNDRKKVLNSKTILWDFSYVLYRSEKGKWKKLKKVRLKGYQICEGFFWPFVFSEMVDVKITHIGNLEYEGKTQIRKIDGVLISKISYPLGSVSLWAPTTDGTFGMQPSGVGVDGILPAKGKLEFKNLRVEAINYDNDSANFFDKNPKKPYTCELDWKKACVFTIPEIPAKE